MAWTERYIRADAAGGGDGTTNTNSGANGAWTLAEAIAAAATELAAISPNSLRMNVKSATYSLSGAITISGAGTATTPIWWRGFNSTIGDLDTATDHTTFPWFDMTGASVFLTVSGAFNWVSNIRLTADNTAASSAAINWTGADGRLFHCHVAGESSDTDGHAISLAGNSDRTLVYCNYFSATTGATSCVELLNAATTAIIAGNYISGGATGASLASSCTFFGNIVTGSSGNGVAVDNSAISIIGNSVYSVGGKGVAILTGNNGIVVANNILSNIGTYAVSHAVADHATVLVTNNAYYTIGTAQLENIPEQFNAITCSASPFVNAGSGDFTPTSEVLALGFPGRAGIASTLNYADIGAIQKQASGGGGGLMRHPGMAGGMNG